MTTPSPNKLGRYEVVEEIGKGAMGVVYLAKDPLIGRLVALKTFRVGYAAQDEEMQQFRERFIREAQSAGILSHPNIVTIHDVVVASEEGVTFIAMEYVRGTNLKELLQGAAPLETEFAVDIGAQVADALDFAHTKGVVHRDVKPANILITADRRVKIADFGIARLNTSNLTFDGQLLGTPNYMAPEQIQGKEVDHRADIFSLGVVLYEMLTRKKPFSGENMTVVTHRIVHEPFTPPEELVPDLPEGLRAVLRRALEKDPERRFARASQMAEDLRRSVTANLNDTLATFVSSRTVRLETVPREAVEPAVKRAPEEAQTTVLKAMPEVAPPVPPRQSGPVPLIAAPLIAAPPPLPDVAMPAVADAAVVAARSAAAALGPTVVLTVSPPSVAAAPPPVTAATPTVRPAKPTATSAPQPEPRARRALRPVHWIVAGLAGLALLCGIGLVVLWLRARSAPPPVIAAVVEPAAEATEARRLLEEGKRLIAVNDVEAAVRVLREAELLDPGLPDVGALRTAAEARLQADLELSERSRLVDAALVRAREAVERRRYDDAKVASGEILLLVPNHEEALDLLAKADQGMARRRERAASQAAAATSATPLSLPAVAEVPATPISEPAVPARTDATLVLEFYSELPKGVVTVYLNDQQLLRQSFKFVKRTNVFRSEGQPGSLSETRTVVAGDARLRVIVALDGKQTRVVQIAGNFPGGSTRTLAVRVDAEGNVTGNLQ
jgi:tRNA A-37 threonylcarbamoyl transferase component Bud32